MLAYHRTAHAEAILRDGFRDATGTYMTPNEYTGVWFSADWPLDENEGARGKSVIVIDLPTDLFAAHEWVEDGKTYREALIPSSKVNVHLGSARVITPDEEEALVKARWAEWDAYTRDELNERMKRWNTSPLARREEYRDSLDA